MLRQSIFATLLLRFLCSNLLRTRRIIQEEQMLTQTIFARLLLDFFAVIYLEPEE